MDAIRIISIGYTTTIGLSVLAGLLRFNRMDKPLKLFLLLMVMTFLDAAAGGWVAGQIGSRMPVSHFFSVIDFSILLLYFTATIQGRVTAGALIIAPLSALALEAADLCFFQDLYQFNTYTLMAESLILSALALYALYDMVRREEIRNIFAYPHFWIWVLILLTWTSTFFLWAFLNALSKSSEYYFWLKLAQYLLFIFIYGAVGVVFFSLKGKAPPYTPT